jgi:hypothetical protein
MPLDRAPASATRRSATEGEASAGASHAAARVAHWLSVRHSLAVEAASVLVLYATYEAARGLVAGNRRVAIDHAHAVAALERKLHLFVEPNVQHAARALPGLLTLLGGA